MPNHYMTLSKGIDSDSQHFGNHRLIKKHKTRLALGTLLLLLIGMGITAQAQTQTISPTPQVKGMHIENVYIPPGSDDDQQILIIGELVCESAIGVTKTKDWRQETPPYGFDFDGDGVFDNGEHIYETDDHFVGVRTPIARVDTMPVAPKNWAFKSFQKFIFFDDKDLYSVWSFNYSNSNVGKNAYSDQIDYFVETWRSYADTSNTHYDTISSSNTSNVFVAIKSAPGFSHMARLVNNGESHANTWFNLTTTINLKDHYWEPVGFGDLGDNCGINPQFDGKFDGRGHFIDSALTILPVTCMGMFGDLGSTGKIIRTFDYDCNFTYTFPELNPAVQGHLGGIVGRIQAGGEVDGCEAAADTMARYQGVKGVGGVGSIAGAGYVNSGGIAGSNLGTIRNSFAVDSKIGDTIVGGLVGGLAGSNSGTVANAYTKRIELVVGTGTTKGALVGTNSGTLTNAYTDATSGAIVGSGNAGSNVYAAAAAVTGKTAAYTPTIGSNHLGYMWYDNVIGEQAPLFETLNNNKGDAGFTWARPALACEEASSTTKPINDDLPVLLLCESHKRELTDADSYTPSTDSCQGGFRAVGTRGGAGNVLQYGGPDRDVNAVNTALTRGYEAKASNTNKDYLFIYGDIATNKEAPTSACSTYTQKKVSIYEHAAINFPGTLANFEETYVGVTFETAGGGNADTLNNNHPNLVTDVGFALQRSWHLFSTPLSSAPLGFDYQGDTDINSYWTNLDGEFSWLEGNPNGTSDGFGARRYWMGDEDGYFPKNVDHTTMFPPKGQGQEKNYDYLFIVKTVTNNSYQPSDECPVSGSYRYPYGMDFYSWEEDWYHYINFKRNPGNHWHTDVDPTTGEHEQIPYPNEPNLTQGKGYMAAIHAKTLLQSHGCLNIGNVERAITKQPSYPIRMVPGWNLIGNPYHGYLNLSTFNQGNQEALGSIMVYVNAGYNDVREGGWEGNDYTGFLYCAPGSSRGSRTVSYLHPHQGFYVKAKKGNGAASFNMEMLENRATVRNNGGYRNDDMQPAYPLVNLYLSSDKGCSDVTVVEFNRPEWGGALKMRDMRIGNGLFYASHGEENYGVLFATPEAERIPLRFEPKEEGNGDTYTISWETANGDFSKLILVDNMTGVQYDMLRNSSYSFNGKMGDYYMRFYITFEVTGLDEEQDEDDDVSTGTASTTFAFFDGSQWVVTNDGHGTATLDLIDLQGRVLHSTTVAEGQARIGLPDVAKGMYLMRMTNQKGMFVQKIVVR